MNPITGKEIRIDPGSIVSIDEFCNMTSSHYYCAYKTGNVYQNYVIKFDANYKDIVKQFPELYTDPVYRRYTASVYWNIMGNNEMLAIDDSNEDTLYLR